MKPGAVSGKASGAARRATFPPEPPDPEALEALAGALEPSLQGAWFTALQSTEHLTSSIARRDPRTGEPLPQSLLDLLGALHVASAEGCRPFPHDQLFLAIELSAAPLAELLDHHRTRIVRTHELLPFHQLREVDGRSLAWLARQPGRTVREKLSGKTHALGMRRERTADTAENRLVHAFARLVAHRAAERLAHVDAYDAGAEDRARAGRLAEMVRLCGERLRRSDLAEVPASERLRPNNVLLGDPRYSRVHRAWRWLRSAEDELRRSWAKVPDRVRTVLLWLTAARLAADPRVLLWDGLARVASGRDGGAFGIQRLIHDGRAPRWVDEPGIDLLLAPDKSRDRPALVRLSLEGDSFLATVSVLEGSGLLRACRPSALRFDVKPVPEPLSSGRGVPFVVVVDGRVVPVRGANRTFADIAGLGALADMLSASILARCGAQPPALQPRRASASPQAIGERIGVELASARVRVNDGQAHRVAVRGWTAAYEIPDDEGRVEWLDGRSDRRLSYGVAGRELRSLGDALDPEMGVDLGALSLAARRMVEALAHELSAPATAQIAYAVPDGIDELSQRTIRAALSASFGKVMPVWRSVAAAMAWQLEPTFAGRDVRPGDHVIVVDAELSSVVVTLLVARHDVKLQRAFPASSGIYWERKPPVPPDEQLELLGWQRSLAAYADALVDRAFCGAPAALRPEERRRIVDELVRTGEAELLLRQGGALPVQPRLAGGSTPAVLEISHDEACLGREMDRWIDGVAELVDALPDAMFTKDRGTTTWLLLAGGPHALSGFSDDAARRLRPRLRSPAKVSIVGLAQGALAKGARECLLRREAKCLAWREWLPDLFLEVVRDGHYDELPLLVGDNIIDPFFGEARSFPVKEKLLLAQGQPWYSFPLIQGKNGGRPLAWEARLESQEFPLDHDVAVQVSLSYCYGVDTSYELTIEPVSPRDAAFTRLEARWFRAGEGISPTSAQDAPMFLVGAWGPNEIAQLDQAASGARTRLGDERFDRYLSGVIKRCWSQGRSLAGAPAPVAAHLGPLRQRLLRLLPDHTALEILCLLHEDAPLEAGEMALSAEHVAGDDVEAYKKTARLVGALVGDGRGARRAYLDRLLARLRRHTSFETFSPPLARTTLGVLSAALWRHPGLVHEFAAGDAAQLVIDRARRSLSNLLSRVPPRLTRDEERESVGKRFGGPYRDACEILLAMVRLRGGPAGAALLRGTPTADATAKAVRQLDARFVRCGVDCRWHVRLEVDVPESLRRMSKVAYLLSAYLAPSGGTNLVEVTGTE